MCSCSASSSLTWTELVTHELTDRRDYEDLNISKNLMCYFKWEKKSPFSTPVFWKQLFLHRYRGCVYCLCASVHWVMTSEGVHSERENCSSEEDVGSWWRTHLWEHSWQRLWPRTVYSMQKKLLSMLQKCCLFLLPVSHLNTCSSVVDPCELIQALFIYK